MTVRPVLLALLTGLGLSCAAAQASQPAPTPSPPLAPAPPRAAAPPPGPAPPRGPVAAPAQASPQPPAPTPAPPATARLTGVFMLTGRVTVATNVFGEHVGQRVLRRWTFTPLCAAGACGRVALVRARASGQDRLTLRTNGPGSYAGTGSFRAPLRCGNRVYPTGELVPFRITVRITRAEGLGGVAFATALRATYTNTSRINLTSCVGVLGHDAATYTGQLAPSTPAVAVDLSGRSPAGS
jgi:hypothetical protein